MEVKVVSYERAELVESCVAEENRCSDGWVSSGDLKVGLNLKTFAQCGRRVTELGTIRLLDNPGCSVDGSSASPDLATL